MVEFEKMKAKGKMDPKVLSKLGIDGFTDDQSASPSPNKGPIKDHLSGRNATDTTRRTAGQRQFSAQARERVQDRERILQPRSSLPANAASDDFTYEVNHVQAKQMSSVAAKEKVNALRMRYN